MAMKMLGSTPTPLPESEVQRAIAAKLTEIEEREVPLLIELEREDRPIWIRFFSDDDGRVTGAAARTDPPSDDEADSYALHSYLDLWQKMNAAGAYIVDHMLNGMALETGSNPECLEVEWQTRWRTLLAGASHGFRLFELDFVTKVLPPLDRMYARAFALMQVYLLRRPEQQTVNFIQRLPKAYVYGLDAEVVILCRATLEAAFRTKTNASRKKGVSALLAEASSNGWLAPDEVTSATEVIRAANQIIHENPSDVQDSLWAIADTIGVVARLLKPEGD
jgi:hypothetical protein